MVAKLSRILGRILAKYLVKEMGYYRPFAVADPAVLINVMQVADVLLVEGNLRISSAIKYITQSTWSHAAIYVGDALKGTEYDQGEPMLIEADLKLGVIAVPLSKYAAFNTRICRGINVSAEDKQHVVEYVISRLGHQYDLKHVFDLARYLVRTPPVPSQWRRRMLALGSGDPTRAICSTLIAQGFQKIRYPILPHKVKVDDGDMQKEIMHIQHHSLFAPRDFDLSPYFEVIKPDYVAGFDYKAIELHDPF